MSIKDVLFHLEACGSQSTVEFATSFAARTDARLTAAGVAIEYPPPAVGPSVGGLGFGDVAALEKLSLENREALERAGREFIADAPLGVKADFTLVQGYRGEACRSFARLARYFDLAIVAQGAANPMEIDGRVLTETLFGSGRPLFIVPFIHKGPVKLDRALICWDGGVQAARALAAAIPLLPLCRSVEIVTIGGNNKVATRDLRIITHLANHGVKARLIELPCAEEIGDALLSYAADAGADYLVMGAYGHWRLTEFVIGGTTRTILGSMTTPVLMAH
ncbi:MAG TPA: universal stress protein [Roseiarcus sp.]|nr:universal stress protein [Roseiarcus sp.]